MPLAIIFLVSILAETNRAPFDLPEAESELVAGYNVEYSGMLFAFFFLGEYNNMLFMSQFFSMLMFAGGSFNIYLIMSYYLFDIWFKCPFLLFVIFFKLIVNIILQLLILSSVMAFFVLVRATLPRYKYNQLMELG
jgi:NADH-quinone oxidoreductase subunit H